jgi:HAE1 family hydrophobic/amphiphilic exporter-1
VRLAGNANENLDTALATVVGKVPLRQLVTMRQTRAPIEVVRVNQRPVTVVEAVAERGGTARAARDVKRALRRRPHPAGLAWRVSGADVEQAAHRFGAGPRGGARAGADASRAGGRVRVVHDAAARDDHGAAGRSGRHRAALAHRPAPHAVSLIGMVVMIGLADNDAVVKLEAIRRFRAQG